MGLGSWIKMIGGSVAAPFTGGATLPLALSGLGEVAGNAAGNSDKSRHIENNTALDYARFNQNAPRVRARTALDAALAQNYTPRTFHWNGPGSGLRGEVPTYSGGFSDAMMKAKQDPMMAALLNDVVAGRSGKGTTIDHLEPKKSSLLDKILGGIGLGASAAGGIMKVGRPPVAMSSRAGYDGEGNPV